MRKRYDLEVQETVYQGEKSWILKDPVALKYFRLQAPEYMAFEMIDGVNSYATIKLHLENQFPEMELRIEDVYALVTSLHKSGLLLSDAAGQDQPLTERRNKELKQKGMKLLMSAMSLKFPGVDPERFLNWLYPKVSWLFSRWATAICFAVCACALMLVLSNLEEFYRKLPEFSQFFNFNNLLFMGSILIVTKSIHELGHGLMCKHFGGECHEIGFMLLVMTPAMYCNTSDSWTLPNKWHRIAIGAAGMYVEVVLAAFATFLWWHTQPGFAHFLALNIMFLCSFSTLVFNANPLLRYDGYYMLSDYLEIPNLSQKSNMALIDQLKVNCLGMKPNNSRLMPQRGLLTFAVYAVASFLYRWFVMLAIFWFLIHLFRPYGLEILGHLLIGMSMIGMVVIPLYKATKFFLWPGRFREVKMIRLLTTGALVFAFAWALFSIPVTHHVTASFVTRPIDAQMVYATAPGTLTDVSFRPGDKVNAGEQIARLESVDLQIEAERLRGQLENLQATVAAYRATTSSNPSNARLIAETKIKSSEVERQIELHKKTQANLVSIAQRDGVVMPPPNIPVRPYDSSTRQLKTWSGTPLDPENENLFVEPGTLICMVGDPERMKATLAVEQSERALVEVGQHVRLMLDEMPGIEFGGTVDFIGQDPMTSVARELSQNNGGGIATRVSATGEEVPMLTWYEVSVTIQSQSDYPLMSGFRGAAKIKTSDMPLGDRLIRYITNVVRFR